MEKPVVMTRLISNFGFVNFILVRLKIACSKLVSSFCCINLKNA